MGNFVRRSPNACPPSAYKWHLHRDPCVLQCSIIHQRVVHVIHRVILRLQ